MFMLRNASKYLFGNPSSKETIIEVPQGQLYLVRPHSPKGYSELIFPDANCSIRRTGQQFQYQLVVQRVYEEGEEDLEAEDEDQEGAAGGANPDKDEKTFLLDESIRFRVDQRHGGEIVFAWRDLSGDSGDLFEFVCDSAIQPTTVANFEVVSAQCQYERKYHRSRELATEADLLEFSFEEQPVPNPATEFSPRKSSLANSPASSRALVSPSHTSRSHTSTPQRDAMPQNASPKSNFTAPPAAQNPGGEVLANQAAELHWFDPNIGAFVMQDEAVQATVSELGGWNYWLHILGAKRDWLGLKVEPDLNPVFNFEARSFIFNHYLEDGNAISWLLRFKDVETLEQFQKGLMQGLWEHLNKTKWMKAKDTEREYALEAFQDLTMEDAPPLEEEDEEDENEEDTASDDGAKSEQYDSDESQDDTVTRPKDKETNSGLAVGFKNDRTFVMRGSKIGVFKHGDGNNLSFQTNINKVQTPKGRVFSPKKVMLHDQDRDMIMQNDTDQNSLYRMDLEYGKVVDEYKVHDDIPVSTFAPEKKYSQMTSEPTFLGVAPNALYRIDPRLSGNKLVDSQLKQYASANSFSAAATTAAGHIAIASDKGDVRLFDRLGVIAKTHIPALGDPIKGLDVSADGHWILATTRTYLLLIDAVQRSGKNEGKLGFEKPFAKDDKPQPRRLGLTPAHVAQLFSETKQPLNFTPARFNTGVDASETTIVTATGPFVIAWSMKKVLKGQRDPYSIKRYNEEVKADDFRYGTDRNFVVALANEVGMERKSALKRATRDSIAGDWNRTSGGRAGSIGGSPVKRGSTPGGLKTPSRSAGARVSALRKNEVVDSPY